jgi:hypothetical protein
MLLGYGFGLRYSGSNRRAGRMGYSMALKQHCNMIVLSYSSLALFRHGCSSVMPDFDT